MLKGLIIGVCVYVLLFLLYLTFGPMFGQYYARMNGTISAGSQMPRNVAWHWMLVGAIGILAGVLLRDLYLYLRVKLRGSEKDKPRS